MEVLPTQHTEVFMCVECEDTAAALCCTGCKGDVFCGLCWMWIHRKGNRSTHKTKKLSQAEEDGLKGLTLHFAEPIINDTKETIKATEEGSSTLNSSTNSLHSSTSSGTDERIEGTSGWIRDEITGKLKNEEEEEILNNLNSSSGRPRGERYYLGGGDESELQSNSEEEEKEEEKEKEEEEEEEEYKEENVADNLSKMLKTQSEEEARQLVDRCKFIPLRMTEEERELLRLLEGALTVSEYTDNVDVADSDYGSYRSWGWSMYSYSKPLDRDRIGSSRQSIIERELNEIFNVISGYYVATNPGVGGKIIKENDVEKRIELLQRIFEIGRRYKIMNPEKMRSTYGKMMYLLQDASKPGLLPFSVKMNIRTVYRFLKEKKSLDILTEGAELLLCATGEVSSEIGKPREQIKREILMKREATQEIIRRFTTENLMESDILLVINSIADNTSFIAQNQTPVDRMINLLTTHFSPSKGPSLELRWGRGGSKLNHDHATQYTFVLQSLLLWREALGQLVKLWFMAEADLLNETHSYRLRDTGQGLNRVQAAPNVGGAMSAILGKVHRQVRNWVGLSVVHLGDRDVPNALIFIDKYTQVSRILSPIASVVNSLDDVAQDEGLLDYFNTTFGSVDKLKIRILQDYFRHGFDGSGSDGGSCIDGRLTSSWNWCSKIEKKTYYPAFLVSGFSGFDGSWKK